MAASSTIKISDFETRDLVKTAQELGSIFAERAAAADDDKFVADNFALLKTLWPGGSRRAPRARRGWGGR